MDHIQTGLELRAIEDEVKIVDLASPSPAIPRKVIDACRALDEVDSEFLLFTISCSSELMLRRFTSRFREAWLGECLVFHAPRSK